MDKSDQYRQTAKTIAALIAGEDDEIAKMATICCEPNAAFDHFDWVGFYRVTGPEILKVGPYQGGHGCLFIPFSKGVCGACARTGETQIVEDVNAIADHIACSASTRSEIVVPVYREDRLIAVLDVDSDTPAAFDQADASELEAILAASF